MDFNRILSIIALAAVIVLVAVFSWKISGNRSYSAGYSDALASIKPDTVYIDSTMHYDKPKPDTVYRDTGRVEYVPVIVKDSTGHADTTAVPMHPEVKQYSDPEKEVYELQISGIAPSLDWIKVHQKTAYINVPVPEYKYPTIAISPSVGAFVAPGHFSFGGGLELDYWKDRWQFSVEGGYGIHSDFKTITPGWYGQVKGKYNLIRK